MKKLIIIFTIITLAGCSMVGIRSDVSDVAERIIARRLAYEIARENPEIIKPGLIICDTILDESNTSTLQNHYAYIVSALSDYTASDPMLRADLMDLLSMLEIKTPDKPVSISVDKLKTAVVGFKQGLEAAKGGP